MGQAVRDIYEGDPRARREVLIWTKSKDFEMVCECAYMHGEDMREQLHDLAKLSEGLAKKFGRMLRDRIVNDVS